MNKTSTLELKNSYVAITLPLGPIYTNAHILYRSEDNSALIIDAPISSEKFVVQSLAELNIKASALLLTHGHWDHIGGAAALKSLLDLPVYAGQGDHLLYTDPSRMSDYAMGFHINPVEVDHIVTDQEVLEIAGIRIKALAMPGHTPGGLAYYVEEAGCVFTGDQLFFHSVGRADFPGSNADDLEMSIRERLYKLPHETIALCGHGGCTNIGEEYCNNPFVPGRIS